jgi:RNA polymerase sigma factor (sigma-70 family)
MTGLAPMAEFENNYDENFSRCYALFEGALRFFIRGIVRDSFIAEELVQDVFTRLYERRVELDPRRETTKSFLFTVAKNRTMDYLRRTRCEEKGYQQKLVEEAVLDVQFYENIENAFIEGEVLSTLHDVLNALPDVKRQVFEKRAMHGVRMSVIEKEFGTSPFMIKKIEKEVCEEIRMRVTGGGKSSVAGRAG